MPDYISDEAEAAEVFQPSYKDIVQFASRYAALKDHNYITADGDVLTKWKYEQETESLNKLLRQYIERYEPIVVEGVGVIKLQPRRNVWHDLAALQGDDYQALTELLQYGYLKVDMKAVKDAGRDDLLVILKKHSHEGETLALVIERDNR